MGKGAPEMLPEALEMLHREHTFYAYTFTV
jgi:hypothetical protein